MSSRVRCLWLSSDVPFPEHSGRMLYSAGLSGALAAAGVEVVALGIDDTGQSPPESCPVVWRPIEREPTPSLLRKVASRWPSSVFDRRTGPYRQALSAAIREGGWDVAVIDFLAMSWTMPILRAAGIPVVFASQNYESALRRDVLDVVSWRDPAKLPLMYDAFRVRRCERMLLTGSALVTAVTESDAAHFRREGATNVLVATPGYSGSRVHHRTISDATPRVAAVVGSLMWHVKRRNLQQFVEAADDILASAGIELRVVGATPPDFDPHQFSKARSVRFTGAVDSIDDQLTDVRVGVISERGGGGFKLKALDYVFHRVPMAVLDGSMDGLPLRPDVDYVRAASEDVLARRIVELIDDPAECQRMQASAFDRCAELFEWSTRGRLLKDEIEKLVYASHRVAACR
ncbi:glycosyltransferase [Desertimonas flava]|uniref:glycosyltransferase n=1 Tax=Desertimonas flava TaxID=2064846 RepID=UPI0013C534F7|nr:glycosyltransferase [Desertimonas flava]